MNAKIIKLLDGGEYVVGPHVICKNAELNLSVLIEDDNGADYSDKVFSILWSVEGDSLTKEDNLFLTAFGCKFFGNVVGVSVVKCEVTMIGDDPLKFTLDTHVNTRGVPSMRRDKTLVIFNTWVPSEPWIKHTTSDGYTSEQCADAYAEIRGYHGAGQISHYWKQV